MAMVTEKRKTAKNRSLEEDFRVAWCKLAVAEAELTASMKCVAEIKNKTCVINDPLGQTHSLASSDHYFLLFYFARFEKWGRTDGQHVQK